MNLKDKIGDFTAKRIASHILRILPKVSDENLIRMTYLAESLTRGDPFVCGVIREVRKYFQEGHPALRLSKKISKNLNPHCRDKLMNNLFINAILTGIHRSKEFERREGFTPPWLIVLSPTMKCNLNCVGCSTREYTKDEDLPLELMDKVLSEAKNEMGIYFIATQGGEMFIREDMFDLYKRHNDVYFQVYTNGTLIDRQMAKRLASLGNVAPILSLEGFKDQTDKRRGEGVYKKVMEAMDNLKAEGVFFGFSVTQTRYNTDIVISDEFIDMLIDKGCYVGWYFQYLPIGKDPDLSLMATPAQRDKLRQRVNQIRATKELFIGDFWNDGPYVGGCIAAGRRYVHINNKGEVEPCAFIHFAVDNIRDKSLKDALCSPFFNFLRERQPFSNGNLFTPCMLIDEPQVLRNAVIETKARPTHKGAETILDGTIKEGLDRYSRELHTLYDKLWQEYKTSRHSSSLCL